ncbi:hypothetical protein V2J09_004175 [Rumex salicifolius]
MDEEAQTVCYRYDNNNNNPSSSDPCNDPDAQHPVGNKEVESESESGKKRALAANTDQRKEPEKKTSMEKLLSLSKYGGGKVMAAGTAVEYLVDLSRLQLGDWFARGAYSELHHGRYKGKPVAVKIISMQAHEQSKGRLEKHFNREVSLLSRLHHRNVIKLVGACRKAPYLYIVTEYLPNGSLRSYLHRQNQKPLPLKTVVGIGLDIARGMQYTHSQGVIHRDLKPENVLIDEAFNMKIADFGIACHEANCDKFGEDPGTFRWMAPEIIKNKSYGRKVDVYSFGLILWEMLSGSIPYQNLNPFQAAYAAVNKNMRPQFPESSPPVMRAIIEQCWSAEQDKRLEFSQIVQLLEEYKASVAIDATLSKVESVVKSGDSSNNLCLLLHCFHNICSTNDSSS